ncbi:MAG: hypothetical protein KDJ35_09225 [Alphaproteobacteria bacterium]|nr:hypothetical protein [Alphaproteobacteria bacterium]
MILPLCALALFANSSAAQAIEAQSLKVSRVGDTDMGCGQISQEAALMRDIVMTTEDIKDDTNIKNHSITAAGAVGSFLVGTVTGGVGIAAAGFLLKNATEDTKEEADNIQDIAEQRRSLMMGIYNAKGCMGPIEHVMQDHVHEHETLLQLAGLAPAAGEETPDKDDEQPHYNQ